MQQKGDNVMRLGKKLSEELHCTVRFPGVSKNFFVCNCGMLFSASMLEESGGWKKARKRHDRGKEAA